MNIQGQIISGEFDVENNEFSLQRVKNFFTESTLKETQLNNIYEYLKKHEQESDGQIITLYDQMPLRLTQVEIKQLIRDLEQVHLYFN
ncbi:hypothetical protein [Peribacillus alkalitolerans]|uniref:hypothetical protein n=1 Tax=Peribacillus alkalitolerans TaxID=1550385 RepID=UPI0013D0499C|nr:hypothetical protein [Peribacillus alkalitolerans]